MTDLSLTPVVIVFQLALLEGLLSFDNAIALAALVKKYFKNPVDQKRALLWGLWGAYIMRALLIFGGVWLMRFEWIKALAGLYLVYLAVKELFFSKETKEDLVSLENADASLFPRVTKDIFWKGVLHIELLDLVFSIDSIAIALAISDVAWVLICGAVLGILLMRIAAQHFIALMDKFPILEKTAFVLVGVAGINVLLGLKDLNLGFAMLSIESQIPKEYLAILMVVILLSALLLNKKYPEKFGKKHESNK